MANTLLNTLSSSASYLEVALAGIIPSRVGAYRHAALYAELSCHAYSGESRMQSSKVPLVVQRKLRVSKIGNSSIKKRKINGVLKHYAIIKVKGQRD